MGINDVACLALFNYECLFKKRLSVNDWFLGCLITKSLREVYMDVRILQLIEGAKQATGVAVIIDVFRAFTVEAYLANNGAKYIIPIGEKETAYSLRDKNKDYILVGERKGVVLPGFDYGNSPSQIENIDFSDRTIVHTTSAGTQGIANAKNADTILSGSLVNAKAIAKYIKQNNFQDVSLVCMGLEGERPIEEDTLCAEYIKSLLEGKDVDISSEIEKLKTSSGAKFFDVAQQSVFPEKDFYLSTELNKFNFVLKLEHGKDFDYMKRIDV